MAYGVPYKGSKNQIANWVVDYLPEGDVLVELFAGGCAVTHAAMERGKYKRYIINDVCDAPDLFLMGLTGEITDPTTVIDRELFFKIKDTNSLVKLCYSFGNDGETYLWGKEIEPIKLAASKMLTANTLSERYSFYLRYVRMVLEIKNNTNAVRLNLQNIERIKRLQNIAKLGQQDISRKKLDYREVDIPEGAVVYADPPYIGTSAEYNKDFDHEAFYRWLDATPHMVIVSEYTQPPNTVMVAEKIKRMCLSATDNSALRVEKLFVQERFADAYKSMMATSRLL